jgi:hypothetical protein
VGNEHAQSNNPIQLDVEFPQGHGADLIVCIGILSNIRLDVESYLVKEGGDKLPLLNIFYSHPLYDAPQANSLVAQTKTAILQSIAQAKAKRIHLFCKSPSFVAMLLGHRLNATTSVQCYEYIAPESYLPTCALEP